MPDLQPRPGAWVAERELLAVFLAVAGLRRRHRVLDVAPASGAWRAARQAVGPEGEVVAVAALPPERVARTAAEAALVPLVWTTGPLPVANATIDRVLLLQPDQAQADLPDVGRVLTVGGWLIASGGRMDRLLAQADEQGLRPRHLERLGGSGWGVLAAVR